MRAYESFVRLLYRSRTNIRTRMCRGKALHIHQTASRRKKIASSMWPTNEPIFSGDRRFRLWRRPLDEAWLYYRLGDEVRPRSLTLSLSLSLSLSLYLSNSFGLAWEQVSMIFVRRTNGRMDGRTDGRMDEQSDDGSTSCILLLRCTA